MNLVDTADPEQKVNSNLSPFPPIYNDDVGPKSALAALAVDRGLPGRDPLDSLSMTIVRKGWVPRCFSASLHYNALVNEDFNQAKNGCRALSLDENATSFGHPSKTGRTYRLSCNSFP